MIKFNLEEVKTYSKLHWFEISDLYGRLMISDIKYTKRVHKTTKYLLIVDINKVKMLEVKANTAFFVKLTSSHQKYLPLNNEMIMPNLATNTESCGLLLFLMKNAIARHGMTTK